MPAAPRPMEAEGSAARRLYERHGFTLESEDPIDVFVVRAPRVMAEART